MRSLRVCTQGMSQQRTRSPTWSAVVLPFVGLRRRDRPALEHATSTGATSPCCGHVRAHRLRRDARLPPAAHPPLVPDLQAGRVHARRARLDGGAGPGHDLGRRPPQAPRAHRQGGRPALARTATAAASRARSPASGTRTWAGCSTAPARRAPERYAKDLYEDRGMRVIHATFWLCRARRLRCCPFALGCAIGGTLADGADRRAVGRRGADLPAAPRHLVDQLRLPLLRHAPLRRRRPLDQRLLALAALVRRVLAPQPPHVPALGGARPARVGARPDRLDRSAHAAAAAARGTWSRSRPSASARSSRRTGAWHR